MNDDLQSVLLEVSVEAARQCDLRYRAALVRGETFVPVGRVQLLRVAFLADELRRELAGAPELAMGVQVV